MENNFKGNTLENKHVVSAIAILENGFSHFEQGLNMGHLAFETCLLQFGMEVLC